MNLAYTSEPEHIILSYTLDFADTNIHCSCGWAYVGMYSWTSWASHVAGTSVSWGDAVTNGLVKVSS